MQMNNGACEIAGPMAAYIIRLESRNYVLLVFVQTVREYECTLYRLWSPHARYTATAVCIVFRNFFTKLCC